MPHHRYIRSGSLFVKSHRLHGWGFEKELDELSLTSDSRDAERFDMNDEFEEKVVRHLTHAMQEAGYPADIIDSR